MSKKCEWCGRYHDERFIYNYYRNDYTQKYKCYEFCSTACKFYFNQNTNLTKVDDEGFTPKEKTIEVKRINQEIKDQYGSWENYKKFQKQKERENNLRIIRNKLFLWVVYPFILYGFYSFGMSFWPLTFFSVAWFIALAANSD